MRSNYESLFQAYRARSKEYLMFLKDFDSNNQQQNLQALASELYTTIQN